jgi:hypothetical protein
MGATCSSRETRDIGAAMSILRCPGNFGSGGISIANRMIAGVAAEPWRFKSSTMLDELPRNLDEGG